LLETSSKVHHTLSLELIMSCTESLSGMQTPIIW